MLDARAWGDRNTTACRGCFKGMPGHSGGRPVQFIHVPKTGGTSVQKLLHREVVALRVAFEVVSDRDLHEGQKTTWKGATCVVFGHAPLGWSPGFQVRQPLYIAVFRDPVAFAVSSFDFIKVRASRDWVAVEASSRPLRLPPRVCSRPHQYHGVAHADPVRDAVHAKFGNLSISDNVVGLNPVVLALVRDKQAAFLFGSSFGRKECALHSPAYAALRHHEAPNAHALNLATFYDEEPLPGGTAECALHLLSSVDLVGVTERLDDLLVQLRWRTGWMGMSAKVAANGTATVPHSNHIDLSFKSTLTPQAKLIMDREASKGIDSQVYRRAVELNKAKTEEAARCLDSA